MMRTHHSGKCCSQDDNIDESEPVRKEPEEPVNNLLVEEEPLGELVGELVGGEAEQVEDHGEQQVEDHIIEQERDVSYSKTVKMTAKGKKEKKAQEKAEVRNKLERAAKDWMSGKFKSLAECSKVHGVNYRTLHKGIVKNGGEFKGSGQFSTILSGDEEKLVMDHVLYVEKIGYGESLHTLRILVHELLIAAKNVNPNRITGLEAVNQMPTRSWVNRFCERQQLSL